MTGGPTTIAFTIHGRPVGKGRPVFSTRGGFPRAVTPAKTRLVESIIYAAALAAVRATTGAEEPLGWDGPVVVEISFHFAIPPSWPKWRREIAAAGMGHTSTPDLDNLAKAVLDGVGNLLWKNDSQVSAISIRKAYTTGPERTEAKIWRRATP